MMASIPFMYICSIPYVAAQYSLVSQDKCCDILDFAAAHLRDVRDGDEGHSALTCRVLSALALVDRKKADPCRYIGIAFYGFSPQYTVLLICASYSIFQVYFCQP